MDLADEYSGAALQPVRRVEDLDQPRTIPRVMDDPSFHASQVSFVVYENFADEIFVLTDESFRHSVEHICRGSAMYNDFRLAGSAVIEFGGG